MHRIRQIIFGLAFLYIILILVSLVVDEIRDSNNLKDVRFALDNIVAQKMPDIEGYDVLGKYSENFQDRIEGRCFYARDYFIIGTSDPENQAIEKFQLAQSEYEYQDDEWQHIRTHTSRFSGYEFFSKEPIV